MPQRKPSAMVCVRSLSQRLRVTASGPTKGMTALSAARRRESGSGLGAVTKGTPLRTVRSLACLSSSDALVGVRGHRGAGHCATVPRHAPQGNFATAA
eukprot:364095-Chlamydomonas_euryale.AAC.3